jgi:adenylate kinase
LIVITGNPGVGKHTVARIVARKLKMHVIDISELAVRKNAILRREKDSRVVRLKKLSSLLAKEVSEDSLVVGHLAPHVLKRRDPSLVVVLRRSPYELGKVYARRGYSGQKSMENLASEAIGVVLYEALKRFGKRKVAEIDATSRKAGEVADEVMAVARGNLRRPAGRIDWLALIAEKGDMNRFFDYR